MADDKEIKINTIILEKLDHYPWWAKEVTSLLMVNNCIDAIKPAVAPTCQTVIAQYVEAGLNEKDITNADIKTGIKEENKKARKRCTKAAGLIQSRIGQKHHQFIASMTAKDMWTALKEKLQDITPMSHMEVILKASEVKMSSYTDPARYYSEFKLMYNKAIGMIHKPAVGNAEFSTKATEIALQATMLRNTTEAYKPLVAQIQKNWKAGNTIVAGNTDLTEACNDIIRYKVPQSSKTLITTTKRKPPKGSCTNEECVKIGRTRHLPAECWKKYPHLKPDFKSQGTKKTADGNAVSPITAPATVLPTTPTPISSWLADLNLDSAVLAITCSTKNCWLLDTASDEHVCNDKSLFMEYYNDPISITGATASSISPGKEKVKINLVLENGTQGSKMTLSQVMYMPQCPANLVSNYKLNQSGVY